MATCTPLHWTPHAHPHQVGKEKAIEAVVRASGGRALVPPRRATGLRLCNLWDDALYTEQDAADVRSLVRVRVRVRVMVRVRIRARVLGLGLGLGIGLGLG